MLTLSSIASSTTRTGSISPAIACAARAPIRHPRIDRRPTECKKLSASEAPDPGRHHVGTPGDIISECPGDFVGIRRMSRSQAHGKPHLATDDELVRAMLLALVAALAEVGSGAMRER